MSNVRIAEGGGPKPRQRLENARPGLNFLCRKKRTGKKPMVQLIQLSFLVLVDVKPIVSFFPSSIMKRPRLVMSSLHRFTIGRRNESKSSSRPRDVMDAAVRRGSSEGKTDDMLAKNKSAMFHMV